MEGQARKWNKLVKANHEKAERVDHLRQGKITDPNAGCLATSLDVGGHGVGMGPGEGVYIRILLPPGTHCAYLQNVTQVKEEHEILLPEELNSESSIMGSMRGMGGGYVLSSCLTGNHDKEWCADDRD